jgi:hydroxypyruvate isomerase
MDRREFLSAGLAASAAATAASWARAETPQETKSVDKHEWHLKYAPQFDMFKHHAGDDPLDQLRFIADQGFRAFQDNDMMGRPVAEQEKLAREMARLGLQFGAFVAWAEFGEATLVKNDPKVREALLARVSAAIDCAARVNTKWCLIVPGCIDPQSGWDYQTANVVEHLRAAAELCVPKGLTIVLEPLNPRDHPRLFLTKIGQAYQICRAVNSPAVKIIDDLYHQQITEGDLIPNIERAWSEIAYFHLGDTPGRREPTTGEINFRNIFKYLHKKGYQGLLGMEHGLSQKGKEGEQALLAAYRACDDF